MYFEEKWYIVLCIRLNCFHMEIMTSSVVDEHISDFEEGEIVDDDSPSSNSLELSANKCDNTKSCNTLSNIDHAVRTPSRFPDRFFRNKSQSYSGRVSENRPRDFPSSRLNRHNQRRANKESLSNIGKKRPQRNVRKNIPRPAGPSTAKRHRRFMDNERDRVRSDTPYEEKLRDFQLRQQRIKGGSSVQESRPGRTMFASLIETENAGTSLLKRLVGSGSLCIKIHDENIVTDERKCNVLPNCEDNNVISNSPVPEIKSSDNVNDSAVCLIPGTDNTNLSNQNDNSVTSDRPSSLSNDAASSALKDADDEWELRLAALRTAVLKKHNERLKRGVLPKKMTSKTCDATVDSFIDELEPTNVCTSSNNNDENTSERLVNQTDDFNTIKSDDCSDMSMDSNYVSDEEVIRQDHALTSPQIIIDKDSIKNDSPNIEAMKRARLELAGDSKSSNDAESVTFDMTDEELELRTLALQSVLQKKPLSMASMGDSMTLSVIQSLNSKSEDDVGKTISDAEAAGARVENKKRKDSEDWEELDEDILRAQLLKTLSAKLPEHTAGDSDVVSNDLKSLKTQKICAPLSCKRDGDAEGEMQCRRWSEKMVPELIISLGGSDSDSDPDSQLPQIDFVKSLDLLLQEAKNKSENAAKSKTKKKVTSPKLSSKKALLKKTSSSTPVAVKHLPIQQQEEYRRLKMKLEERMTSNPSRNPGITKTAPPKCVLSVVSEISSQTLSKDNSIKPLARKSETINLGNKKLKTENNQSLKQSQSSVKHNTTIVNRMNTGALSKANNAPFSVSDGNQSIKRVGHSAVPAHQVALRTETRLVNKVHANIALKKKVNTLTRSENKVVIRKSGQRQHVCTPSTDVSKVNLKSQTDSQNVKEISYSQEITTLNSDSLKSDAVSFNKELTDGTNAVASQGDESLNSSVKESKDAVVTSCEDKDSSLVTKERTLVSSPNQNIESKSHCIESARETDAISLKEDIKNDTSISDKRRDVTLNKTSGACKGILKWTVKDNEGNSDKENDVIKGNKIGAINSSKDDSEWNIVNRLSPSSLGKESQSDLVAKLQEAELKYEETLALINRLEMELRAAKKDLVDRGKTVEELKEKINDPSKLSTLNVKVSEDARCDGPTEFQQNSHEILEDLPKDLKCCWDPDGVLCPFQLAGSCKDPCCSFHHIASS